MFGIFTKKLGINKCKAQNHESKHFFSQMGADVVVWTSKTKNIHISKTCEDSDTVFLDPKTQKKKKNCKNKLTQACSDSVGACEGSFYSTTHNSFDIPASLWREGINSAFSRRTPFPSSCLEAAQDSWVSQKIPEGSHRLA